VRWEPQVCGRPQQRAAGRPRNAAARPRARVAIRSPARPLNLSAVGIRGSVSYLVNSALRYGRAHGVDCWAINGRWHAAPVYFLPASFSRAARGTCRRGRRSTIGEGPRDLIGDRGVSVSSAFYRPRGSDVMFPLDSDGPRSGRSLTCAASNANW
jgi:hypothetical protein